MSKRKISRYIASNAGNQNERIDYDLKQLGLEGIRSSFIKLAEENIANHGTPKDYLELLLERQRHYKEDSRIQSRIRQARFTKMRTLSNFLFEKQPNINPRQIHDLASCTFVEEKKNVIFYGQSGVGKTHLAIGLGLEAIAKGWDVRFIELDTLLEDLMYKYKDADSQHRFLATLERPALLILDEIKGYETSPTIRDFLYRLLRYRYEKGKSTLFTSNQDFTAWAELFGDDAEAILDRILDRDRLILISIEGKSQRVNDATVAVEMKN